MTLYTFGDSWTEGVGADLNEENQTNTLEEKTEIRKKYCWPKHLSEYMNVEYENLGVGGSSNEIIFNSISHCLQTNKIKKNDFVVIMWSSSLRDNVVFFPKENDWYGNDWYMNSKYYLLKKYLYEDIFSFKKSKNKSYDTLKKQYKEFYITNLYNENYYNIVNQNYITYLQFMFKNLGIRYLFCDGFDTMVDFNLDKNIDKTEFIDKNHYWNFSKKTFRDFLLETEQSNIWENYKNRSNKDKHPNKYGYKLIATELFEFINKKNLLEYEINNPINYII